MRMRFDVAVAVTSCLLAGGAMAATPAEVFEANRDAVLRGECIEADGVRFGIGAGTPLSASQRHAEAAMAKADLNARVNLVCRKSAEGIVWPESLPKEDCAILSAYASRVLTAKATVRGAERVYSSRAGDGACTVVVAAPAESLSAVMAASLADAKRVLLSPIWLKRHFHRQPQAFYDFYLTQKKLPEELVGTDWREWSESQLNLFCGLPPVEENKVCEPAEECNGSVEEEEPDFKFILPPYATANENETFGF